MSFTDMLVAPLVLGAIMMAAGWIIDAVRSTLRPRSSVARSTPHARIKPAFGPQWSRN